MLIALSVSGSPQAPVYAAAMAKMPGAATIQPFLGLTFNGFQTIFNTMAAQKMGCYQISATGSGNATLYAAAFRPVAAVPTTRHRMTQADFAAFQDDRRRAGERILTVDVFGDPGVPLYCAVWEPNPGRVAWSIGALDEDAAPLQRRFDRCARSAPARPISRSRRRAAIARCSPTATWRARGSTARA